MSGLFEALPLLSGWRYHREEFDIETGAQSILVRNGGEKTLLDLPEADGWILELSMTTTCPNAFYIYGLGAPPAREFQVSAYMLKRQNRTLPAPAGFYATQLDKTLLAARKTITTAGTPETLGTRRVDGNLSIKALSSNTGVVRIASSTTRADAAATSITLDPGNSVTLQNPGSLRFVFLDVAVSGEGVEYSHESEDHTFDDETEIASQPLYAFHSTPAMPQPFKNGLKIRVFNPDYAFATQSGVIHASPMYIQRYLANLVIIENRSLFIESYRNLLGTVIKG